MLLKSQLYSYPQWLSTQINENIFQTDPFKTSKNANQSKVQNKNENGYLILAILKSINLLRSHISSLFKSVTIANNDLNLSFLTKNWNSYSI